MVRIAHANGDLHNGKALLMSEETPVDYDDPNDPDTPTTPGDAIINAVGFVGAIENVVMAEDTALIFVWSISAAEQIEAHLQKMGWKIERARPWKQKA